MSGNMDTSIDTFIWNKGNAILNQHIFKVIPKIEDGYAFIYLILKYLKSIFTHIVSKKQTIGLNHVTDKDLKELNISVNYDQLKNLTN
ncbi:restriction endonuclease subunit S [Paraclostridium sordellii]|uniref:restriction endonuclease subunit S n=1 Tax=Paraclostridium sordellii TaxID=1505 RepID=UPI0012D76A4D|nr:restriction endonuclease subunit S [Paeniclostridium sordellii]